MTRRIPLIFWIVLLSFLIRIAFILFIPTTTISMEGDDAGYYQLTALQLGEYFQKGGVILKDFFAGNLFKGGGMLERYGLGIPWGAFERGLTYPFFLALIFLIFGPNSFIVLILQAFLMSLASGLVYGIGKELGKPKAGLLGAALMGIYLPFIFIVSQLFQETLAVFLFSLFYFLVFRSHKRNSARLYSVTGLVLFFLSLSRPPLAFFPFFLFAGIIFISIFFKQRFSLHRFWLLAVSFLVPYGIWGCIVSWQVQHPAIFVTPVGQAMLPAVLPDYDGWMPDSFLGNHTNTEIAEILRRVGLKANEEGKWPPKPEMVGAALRILRKHPWISLQMGLDKFRRLWWRPYDWPWREFLFPPQPSRWFHRFLVVAALLGGVLWFFERPVALSFLLAPAFYSMVPHSFFHVESRYGLPWLTFIPLLAGFFLHFLWRNRQVLFTRKTTLGLGAIFMGGVIFHLSRPEFLFQSHLLAAGIQSVLLMGLVLFAGFWLRPVLSKGRVWATMGVGALLIVVPFGIHAFTRNDWRIWETPLGGFDTGVRQEIFLPPASLAGSISQNLRIDASLPKEPVAWSIQINGKSIGTLENLKANTPHFLAIPTYSIHLKDAGKEPFETRQWFSLPIPSGLLKEGDWNAVEIHGLKGVLFGDFPHPVLSQTPVFSGPLFHRSMTETSVYAFFYNDDFRLSGRTPLHHQGVKAFYGDHQNWRTDDLSPSWGIQKGEYRIRIEVEQPKGQFLIY